MNVQILYSVLILVMCLTVVAKKEKEQEEPPLTNPIVSYTATGTTITGSEAKLKLKLPTTEDNYKKDSILTKRLADEILKRIDFFIPTTFESVPFLNMRDYQKYYILMIKEVMRTWRFNDKESFEEHMSEIQDIFGLIYDYALIMSLDFFDDKILENRERLIVRKVKKYLKLSLENYLGIPVAVQPVLYKIEESSESESKNYPDKIELVKIIKESKKGCASTVTCYINNKAMDKKYFLKPVEELKQFTRDLKIDENSDDYTTMEKTKIWICKDYDKNYLKEPFVLFEYEKIFKNKKGKSFNFWWIQTYIRNKRVELFDSYRLIFKMINIEIPEIKVINIDEKEKGKGKKKREESESESDESERDGRESDQGKRDESERDGRESDQGESDESETDVDKKDADKGKDSKKSESEDED